MQSFLHTVCRLSKPGIEHVQALADISHSALCCHSNETRAPVAHPPNSAQLGAPRTIPAKLHPCLCSTVGMRQGTDTQTYAHTDGHDHYTFCIVYDSRKM